ncbi:TPA: tail fiber assembly protein [Escherichia coli]|jgi:hypothetical protein|uniref:tail fiber assembly protein n=1 Tax=Enterobacteriaceae TaxID=543 RepID=UPI000B7CE7B6|nr:MULTISPECIES: tail fiber assembly protein [Enterobacteriaceae]AUK17628.1 tail fiber assembly protein [Escherichia coli]EFC0403320.1 tail fiber assembly protein [Escherichia coli]EFC7614442.1 tail fiber assembly protein [Escherichia albertii]EHM4576101.1 tail fiber assembly protein [Escherichia coli]EKB4280035.1 tail fiber assembly protein [Escherichia albertii]
MRIFFSASTLWFYDETRKEEYHNGIGWPDDAIEISDDEWNKYTQIPPDGFILGATSQGRPAWILISPPDKKMVMDIAETKKQQLISQANEYMNSKQWPGKAAIGRLKGEELAQYNLWLDYLDALELVDTSSAPDIEWPTSPAVQAR